jgi:hypothetical protein
MLDQRDHPAGHEPCGPHRGAAPGELAHLDHPAPVDHLDTSPGAGGRNLVVLGHAAGIDDYLDLVTAHDQPSIVTS